MFKKNKCNLNYRFLILFFFTAFAFFIISSNLVLAETVKPDIQISIGGFTKANFSDVSCVAGQPCPINWISEYIAVIYKYGIGLAAVLATIMIMIGGFIWLTSAGSPDKVGKGKEFITSALTGLLLALFSYMILATVNPNLVSLTSSGITMITPAKKTSNCETGCGKGEICRAVGWDTRTAKPNKWGCMPERSEDFAKCNRSWVSCLSCVSSTNRPEGNYGSCEWSEDEGCISIRDDRSHFVNCVPASEK